MTVHPCKIFTDTNGANCWFICRYVSLTVSKTAAFESERRPRILKLQLSRFNKLQKNLPVHLLISLIVLVEKHPSCPFPSSTTKLREVDAKIIRDLNIQHICDLMIEVRKKANKKGGGWELNWDYQLLQKRILMATQSNFLSFIRVFLRIFHPWY